jgi:hypothetical protein
MKKVPMFIVSGLLLTVFSYSSDVNAENRRVSSVRETFVCDDESDRGKSICYVDEYNDSEQPNYFMRVDDPIDPGADEPVADEPVADEPGADEPGADEPGADEPGAGDSDVGDSDVGDSDVGDSDVGDSDG